MLYKYDTSSSFLKMIDRSFLKILDCVVATLKDEADMKHKYTKTQIQIRKYTNTKHRKYKNTTSNFDCVVALRRLELK